MADQWIYWLHELRAEHNNRVGKKCANLGELTKGGFRVPPGYALSVDAYSRFMSRPEVSDNGLLRYLSAFRADPNDVADFPKFDRASEEMRGIVESARMPADIEEQIRKYYAALCREANCEQLFVATRSAGPVSHPGQYETYLNVSGDNEVVQNVIRVWSSTFNARSLIARARLGLPLHYDPIGVAVLTMVDARAAGVMFTVNPVNGDESKVAIEASFGFGEAVVSGSVNPDRYLVDKVLLEIEERVVSDKGAEFVYNAVTMAMEYKELPPDRRKLQCLEDREILELTRIGKNVERYFGCPQDIEYSISMSRPFPDNIFLVQARPESIWGNRKRQAVLQRKSGLELLFEKAVTPTKI